MADRGDVNQSEAVPPPTLSSFVPLMVTKEKGVFLDDLKGDGGEGLEDGGLAG